METVNWTVAVVSVDGYDARTLLRDYFDELVARYHDRPATREEVSAAMADDPSDVLRHPTGRFLLARAGGRAAGCCALKMMEPGAAEVVRMYVRPRDRGRGGGAELLAAAEAHARHLGVRTLRLQVRSDLVEARRLYVAHGFEEVERFTDSPYADHCYAKAIG